MKPLCVFSLAMASSAPLAACTPLDNGSDVGSMADSSAAQDGQGESTAEDSAGDIEVGYRSDSTTDAVADRGTKTRPDAGDGLAMEPGMDGPDQASSPDGACPDGTVDGGPSGSGGGEAGDLGTDGSDLGENASEAGTPPSCAVGGPGLDDCPESLRRCVRGADGGILLDMATTLATTYRVTRLVAGDGSVAKRLLSTMAEVFEEEHEELRDEHVAQLLANDQMWLLAATSGEEIVGGLTAHALPMTRSESREIFIYDIAVRGDHQRRGVGRLLMSHLVSLARDAGVHDLFVAADDEDAHAFEFYRALGGAPSSVTFFTFGLSRRPA
jgi:aminoglycoside 3-N-acetyltransferase I